MGALWEPFPMWKQSCDWLLCANRLRPFLWFFMCRVFGGGIAVNTMNVIILKIFLLQNDADHVDWRQEGKGCLYHFWGLKGSCVWRTRWKKAINRPSKCSSLAEAKPRIPGSLYEANSRPKCVFWSLTLIYHWLVLQEEVPTSETREDTKQQQFSLT